jgi:uncharacterized membrane protein YccF (DUF307 family)
VRNFMTIAGNLIWFLLGGVVTGLAWWMVGLLAYVSVVGIPWGKACFVLGQFHFWPFGREAVSRSDLYGRDDIGTGAAGTIGNVVWFILAGWWLAILHVLSALACFVTIIGIPFAFQHLKFVGIALAPIGKTVVRSELVGAVRSRSLASSS